MLAEQKVVGSNPVGCTNKKLRPLGLYFLLVYFGRSRAQGSNGANEVSDIPILSGVRSEAKPLSCRVYQTCAFIPLLGNGIFLLHPQGLDALTRNNEIYVLAKSLNNRQCFLPKSQELLLMIYLLQVPTGLKLMR